MKNTKLASLEVFEKRFEVSYPILVNATYKSLVNYASDLKSPIQRWYRYKEGYSVQLMTKLFKEYGVKEGDIVLDPFCGSGSTLIQAKLDKFESVGFEINPFSAFLGKAKTQNYSKKDLDDFRIELAEINISLKGKNNKNIDAPKLSIVNKLYDLDVLQFLLRLREIIYKISNVKVRDLFFLAWLAILEEVSHHRKAGNGLKIRKEINGITRNLQFARTTFTNKLLEILEDMPYAINVSKGVKSPAIFEQSALTLGQVIKKGSVKAVIFSPPYANCFDYTEIYKVELWMGEFVQEYSDLTELRRKGIRSHLNGFLKNTDRIKKSIAELDLVISDLNRCDLWDKRIPSMVSSYFDGMFEVLDQIYIALKKGGYCAIVVSNSAYGGIVVPTDLLLAAYAEKIGFKVVNIEVARFIITSSQQYKKTEDVKNYLRESVIHLKKL